MTSIGDRAEIRDAVWGTLDAMFPNVRFAGVTIREGDDFDAFPALWIDAYYDCPDRGLTGQAMNMAIGEARRRLERIGCDRFPIFTYISTREKKPPRAAQRAS